MIKMYKLYHQDQLLFEANRRSKVEKYMQEHLRNVLGLKTYYQRWVDIEENKTMIDYGSHTQFYYIVNE
jgi:hypothetical protein